LFNLSILYVSHCDVVICQNKINVRLCMRKDLVIKIMLIFYLE